MSKRKTKRRQPPAAPPRFQVGDRVRVRRGTCDCDYPDLPLGGWAGVVSEVHRDGMYTVCWTPQTLAAVHPVYERRCEIAGLQLGECWLAEADLEPDAGGPLRIEHPVQIEPRPLSADDEGDRVRMVFGLTGDDLLPAANGDTLETYYDYLAERLRPAEIRYCAHYDFRGPSPLRPGQFVGLDRELCWDRDDGILCRVRTADGERVVPLAELEFRRTDPNRQLAGDFAAWFVGELLGTAGNDWYDEALDDEDDLDEEDPDENDGPAEEAADFGPPVKGTWRELAQMLLEIVTLAAWYGAAAGAAFAAMPWTRWAAGIAGGAWALIVMLACAKVPHPGLGPHGFKLKRRFDVFLGLCIGALQGAMFGILAVACVGAVLGGVVGWLVRRALRNAPPMQLYAFPGAVVFSAICGAMAQAFYLDQVAAAAGFQVGALTGLAAALLICLSVPLLLWAVTERR